MPSGVTHILFHLGIILIIVSSFYSGMSGSVRTVLSFQSTCSFSISLFQQTRVNSIFVDKLYLPADLCRGPSLMDYLLAFEMKVC
jgi:hypothetical protein